MDSWVVRDPSFASKPSAQRACPPTRRKPWLRELALMYLGDDPKDGYISPHCEITTCIFGLLLASVYTASIFRMTRRPSTTRP